MVYSATFEGMILSSSDKGCDTVVKGVSRRVIVIKSPDRRMFEEAIFIVKEDIFRETGVSSEMVLREAQEVADRYVRDNLKKRRFRRFPAPAFAFAGAAATGIIWLLTHLL